MQMTFYRAFGQSQHSCYFINAAILIMADYTCRALCGPVLALTAASLERSGLQAGSDYRLVAVGLDPKDTAADARAMKAAQLGADGPLASAATSSAARPMLCTV